MKYCYGDSFSFKKSLYYELSSQNNAIILKNIGFLFSKLYTAKNAKLPYYSIKQDNPLFMERKFTDMYLHDYKIVSEVYNSGNHWNLKIKSPIVSNNENYEIKYKDYEYILDDMGNEITIQNYEREFNILETDVSNFKFIYRVKYNDGSLKDDDNICLLIPKHVLENHHIKMKGGESFIFNLLIIVLFIVLIIIICLIYHPLLPNPLSPLSVSGYVSTISTVS